MGEEEVTSPFAGEDHRDDDSRPAKKQRNFIARQACEACRLKKTRCDEDIPCSLCRSLGIECTYVERKPTKNETSMSMIFNTLKRMESKLDHISERPSSQPSHEESSRGKSNPVSIESPRHMDTISSNRSLPSPQSHSTRPPTHRPSAQSAIPFSAHQTIRWPGIQALLPASLMSTLVDLEATYPTHVESQRPPLETAIQAQGAVLGDWLSSLSLSCVKELSNAYFDTFNRVYPFIDRDFYFVGTLSVVVREGFGYDIESCLVLNVMALGCMALKAFEEGGFDTSQHASLSPLIQQIMEEEIAGLSFFNEARKRVGFCLCDRDIQTCQYYLTSAVFFAQVMRPVDQWMMTNRAAVSCRAFWKCPPEAVDAWAVDMQSRLFWSAVMLEIVIVQEIELPSSGLKEWEDVVPLPKFTICPYLNKAPSRNSDDSHYHYHFLAQIAHRIILSRVRDELFYSNPSTTLADELWHQLEQWRANLPKTLQFDEDNVEPVFDSPADAVVVALLRARYRISIFHLGRPFLYKAIHHPASLTETDLEMCSKSLHFAMEWPLAWDVCIRMKNFMPLKYFICGQMFGQLFILHAFKNSSDRRLREVIPAGFDVYKARMLKCIPEFAIANPTIAMDLELLTGVYHFDDV